MNGSWSLRLHPILGVSVATTLQAFLNSARSLGRGEALKMGIGQGKDIFISFLAFLLLSCSTDPCADFRQSYTSTVGCLSRETSQKLILFRACRVLWFSVLKMTSSVLITELTSFNLLFSHYSQYSSFSPSSHPHFCRSPPKHCKWKVSQSSCE